MNKTYAPNPKDLTPEWYFIDASGEVLGRLATKITSLLLGKNTATYTPGVVCGNHVVVTNASKVRVTGNKSLQKVYYRHSNYPGGLKHENFADLLKTKSERIIEYAVSGMLPTTKLRKKYMVNLHVYRGSEHPHVAQIKDIKK